MLLIGLCSLLISLVFDVLGAWPLPRHEDTLSSFKFSVRPC